MILKVAHETRYIYNKPVALGTHTVRLRPRADGYCELRSFTCRIDPEPSSCTSYLDLEGNGVSQIWFEGQTSHLEIRVDFSVDSLRSNPLDYLLDASAQTLPLEYPGNGYGLGAEPYRRPSGHPSIVRLANDLACEAGASTLSFLDLLCQHLHRTCETVVRETGAPQAPEQTLQARRGSCRDLTVLFMDACRAQRIAARFVSGFQRYGGRGRRYMHAWPEVYLPGGGWRGFDPTHGSAVADCHVAVAAAREPRGAAPIQGSFAGNDVTSKMEVSLEISG